MNEAADAPREREFEALLQYLRQNRGFDFSGYKRPSLVRRIAKRMQLIGIDGFSSYMDYLEVHPDEFALLFNTILINVTAFFRDAHAWDYLAAECLPKILAAKKKDEPIRVWSAGCASGEEAYSIAMLLAEALGPEAFRERVKIYATDVDEEALNVARLASYEAKQVEPIDPPLRDKYLEPQNGRHVFRLELRRSIVFGRHDLTQDAPISRLDLLICRNTLMYFNAETQGKILSRLHFALNDPTEEAPGGVLFVGRAEMLLTHSNLFAPLELKCRVFAKVPQVNVRNRTLAMSNHNAEPGGPAPAPASLHAFAIDESPLPGIVVDASGTLVHANRRMRQFFGLNVNDVGRPFRDLEISYRPIELRSLIEQAFAERRALTQLAVERRLPSGEVQVFDVVATPLGDGMNPLGGVQVTFSDVTRSTTLEKELQQSKEEIQTANEELQSSNEELQTTNEELQSSNEELETTNEELQSTNEELETMNEELQSTNEELQTVNTELRERTEDLNRNNAFLESVFASMRSGAVVVDRNLNVEVWSERAADLWGLRADEVQGQSVLNLDIGLPIGQMRDQIRACASGASRGEEAVLEAMTRRGKKIRCRVNVRPVAVRGGEPRGAILLMDEVEE